MSVPKMPVKVWVQVVSLFAALAGVLWFAWTLWRRGEHVPAMIVTVGAASLLQLYAAWQRHGKTLQS